MEACNMDWINLDNIYDEQIYDECLRANASCDSFLELVQMMRNNNDVLKAFIEDEQNLKNNKHRISFVGSVLLFCLIHERGLDLHISKNNELHELFKKLLIRDIVDYNKIDRLTVFDTDWIEELLNSSEVLKAAIKNNEESLNSVDNIEILKHKDEVLNQSVFKELFTEMSKNITLRARDSAETTHDISINIDKNQEIDNLISEFFHFFNTHETTDKLSFQEKQQIAKDLKNLLTSNVEFKSLISNIEEYENFSDAELASKEDLYRFLDKLTTSNLQNEKVLHSLKTDLSDRLKKAVEDYLYSDKILDEVVENLKNKKFIDKCEQHIKDYRLKKDFSYDTELLYAKKVINKAIDQCNANKDFALLNNIEDPLKKLNEDEDFTSYFKNLNTLAGLNIALKDENFENDDRISFMKYCINSRRTRNFINDCIDEGSVFDYIGIKKTDELSEFINFGREFFRLFKKLKSILEMNAVNNLAMLAISKVKETSIKFSLEDVKKLTAEVDDIVEEWMKNDYDKKATEVKELRNILEDIEKIIDRVKNKKAREALEDLADYIRMLIGGKPLQQQLELSMLDLHEEEEKEKTKERRQMYYYPQMQTVEHQPKRKRFLQK